MTVLVVTTRTTEEMRAARESGESKIDWAFLGQNALDGIEPEDDDADSPDATTLMRTAIAKQRVGRQRGTKEQVAIRFDKGVLAAVRAAGPDWQTRMHATLKEGVTKNTLPCLICRCNDRYPCSRVMPEIKIYGTSFKSL
ncbi:BrnA antitoxin family protein [Candidatus Methylospira mobilis]|uniref:BrnA antitoxin family protein n=1 Tax=Candidatus Methylospira mobilis TaxID=1808979 RepID=A0A5Q0BQE2_9GAMM|nr:BrnA antitoxin family protein [Candidatus Methylospira mobilis]QFY44521.1 BrnA antitoxin family protein [Candidatus Methylospira mobilis]